MSEFTIGVRKDAMDRLKLTSKQVDRALEMYPDDDEVLACTKYKAQLNAKANLLRRNRQILREVARGLAVNIRPTGQWFEPECAQLPEMWFSNDPVIMDRAQSICYRCPIQLACLRRSIEQREYYGMWGGLDENRRRSMIREYGRNHDVQVSADVELGEAS